MIYLHTGQPGAGKTLYTLYKVRQRAMAENRPVFYAGIEILKPEEFPNWQLLDNPEKWFDLPDGSIIVHDECQTLYRPRGNGAAVPEYVARFETHRHQGHDVYLITQHPMLIDTNIRRLAGEHVHIVRAFGAKFSVAHKWQQVKEQCDKSRNDSLTEQFLYPKELFEAYKSATIHTHQSRLPLRAFALVLVPFALAFLGWMFYGWYQGFMEPTKGAETLTPVPAFTAPPGQAPGISAPVQQSREEWLATHQPRIHGLAYTAPRYDSITQPVTAPVPVGCVSNKSKGCVCYSQQGTRLEVPQSMCSGIVERGYFIDFEHTQSRDRGRDEAARPAATAQDLPSIDPDGRRFVLIGSPS
jgi:zona occludens toxin